MKQIICVGSGIITAVSLAALLVESHSHFCKFQNPKYYAVQSMTEDMAKMCAK